MSTRDVSVEQRAAGKSDNLTANCEPTVYTMWDPQHLITLYVSTAYYGNSFTFLHSEFLAANPEVLGSIPGAVRFSE
jgi:hypothetical protein